MSVVLQLPPPLSDYISIFSTTRPLSLSLIISCSNPPPSLSHYTGLQTQEVLRGHTGSPGQHCTGLLEDGQES